MQSFKAADLGGHQTQHHIRTSRPPAYSHSWQHTPHKLAYAKVQFDKMLNNGVIHPSNSPYTSPLPLLPKPGGKEYRICINFRKLNLSTVSDRYPVPLIHNFVSRLQGARIFSKIDLTKAYHQIPVALEDIPKTAVTTPIGLYEFLKMLFGLRNSVYEMLHRLPYICAYTNNILVASKDVNSHRQHLPEVFQWLSHNSLKLNLDKYVFRAPSIDFLRHHTDMNGISPLPAKIGSIQDFSMPTSIKQLQRLIGMISFYRQFIPDCSTIFKPLTNLLQRMNKGITLEWDALHAFHMAKTALANFTSLSYVNNNPWTQPSLTTDTSDAGVGAVVEQEFDPQWKPIEFFSSKLLPAQRKYSTFSWELLTILLDINHFRHLMEGREFTIYIDHKPLMTAMSTSFDKYTSCKIWHLDYLSQFLTNICYAKGKDNAVADTLPWRAIHSLETDVLSQDLIAARQKSDSMLQDVLTNTSLKFRNSQHPSGTTLCTATSA